MKEIQLLFLRNGTIKIFAEGQNGKGTEKFTENLAKALGTIIERHKGEHHDLTHEHRHVHIGASNSKRKDE